MVGRRAEFSTQGRTLRRKKTHIAPLDILVMAFLLTLAGYIGYRIKVGLNYKWRWEVMPQYLLRQDAESQRWLPGLLMQGFFTTIRLSVWSTLLATFFGIVMGLCRLSQRLFERLLGRTYVELIRNLPPLVLIFIFYYFVSDQIMPILGVETFVRSRSESTQAVLTFCFAPPSRFTAFCSALLTVALFEGAYITEIFRAGIQSIEKGQWEASSALGFAWRQQMRYIIWPQALVRILPPLAGQFISTIKDSAIVSAISIPELTFQGQEMVSATYLTFEVWITVTLLYLLLTLPCSLAVARLEKYLRRREA